MQTLDLAIARRPQFDHKTNTNIRTCAQIVLLHGMKNWRYGPGIAYVRVQKTNIQPWIFFIVH